MASSSSSSSTPAKDDNVTKEDVLRLMDKRKDLEDELAQLFDVLKGQGVGMEEALVDAEGFPRNDIDVYQVRTARHKIICLRNDLKALMTEIEAGLHNLHAQSREGIGLLGPVDTPAAASSASSANPAQAAKLPAAFAKVDVVSEGSPAERAGLQVGDEIAEFGSVTAANFSGLAAVAELVQHSREQEVAVKVVRGGRTKALTLVPREWSGRGLLGCNLVPIESGFVDR